MNSVLVRWAAFLLAPLVILLVVRNDLHEAGWIDPIIYLAYAHDYVDIAARYPGTYYSSRLSHILPNAVAFAAFGDRAGYYVVRYLALVVAMVAIHRIARHYAGETVAWLLALFFCSHVWFLRSLLWDHYEASVVVYALIGIALTLPHAGDRSEPESASHKEARRADYWAHAAAGFAFAWSINGNPMGLVIVAAWFPAWLIERWHWRLADKLRLIAAGLAGAALGQGALFALIAAISPDGSWGMAEMIVHITAQLLTSTGASYFKSLPELLIARQSYQPLLLPFAVMVAVVAVAIGGRVDVEGRRRALAALAFISVMVSAFLALHLLKVAVLSLFYYVVYALPAVLVATAALAGAALAGNWRVSGRSAAIAGGVFFVAHIAFSFVAHGLIAGGEAGAIAPYALPLAVVAVVALMAVIPLALIPTASIPRAAMPMARRNRTLALASLSVALFASNGFFLHPTFTRVYGDEARRSLEWDVRAGALHLQEFVKQQVPRSEPVRFWYGNRDTNIHTVQSTHLWGMSRLADGGPANAAMPDLDASARKRLVDLRHLMILGDGGEIDAALASLRSAGFQPEMAAKSDFTGKSWRGFSIVHVTLRR